MATDKQRFSIVIDDELSQKIENFRFENRYPNRNQALLELLKIGLENVKTVDNDSVKMIIDK